jgi:hypothetical protein
MKRIISSFRAGLIGIGSFMVMSALLTSCLKNNDDTGNAPVAGVMAFNLAPDKSAVGISLSGNSIANAPLGYAAFTGTYLAAFPGSRTVGSYDFNDHSPIAESSAFMFEADKYYSVFVAGANNVFRNIVVEDKFDSLSGSSGQAYIRYINAIPDSSRPTVTIGANGTNAINEQASFAAISDFKAVSPGQVNIAVNNGGSINAGRTITVEQRKVYTVLLIGKPGAATNGVEIRFIENGLLDETDGQRVASGATAIMK